MEATASDGRAPAAAAAAAAAPHGLVLSFPMQGHINPLMHLSWKLAALGGVRITFVLSEQHLARAVEQQRREKKKQKKKKKKKKKQEEEEEEEEQEEEEEGVRLVGVADKLPANRTGGAEFRDSLDAQANMREGVELLAQRLRPSLTFLLADTFVDWASDLSSKLHLPFVAFFTSNAASSLIFLHAPSLASHGILPFRDDNDDFIANQRVVVPGIPPIFPRDFPLCFTFGASHYRYQFVLRHQGNFRHCAAMLMNSFEELESTAFAALREHVPVLPIGPLLLLGGRDDSPHNKPVSLNYWEEHADCLKWLDTQKPSSVLFVAFGSIATMSASQMEELALGLEASQQPFLWVVRADSVGGSLASNLPEGFLARTKARGLIIPWAPQLAVLSHAAVGGFVTHCGWNSTLENLSLGGLPTICWPLVAEQRMNCRIFVDEWKMGIEIMKGDDGMVRRQEVERAVRALMQGEEGREMRAKAAQLQDKARKVMEETGSSVKNFRAFVEACRLNTLKPRP